MTVVRVAAARAQRRRPKLLAQAPFVLDCAAGSTSSTVYTNYYDAPFVSVRSEQKKNEAVRPIKFTLLPFYLHGQQTNK